MKMAAMSARDRRALMIGAIITVPGLAIPFVVKPYFHMLSSVRGEISDERDRLANERRDIADLKTLPARRAQITAQLTKEVDRLFQGSDPLVASGDLAQYVATLAQSDGLRLDQSETRPTRPLIPGVDALQVEVRAQGDLDGILHFLEHLETGDKLIRVGAISIEGGQQPPQIPGHNWNNGNPNGNGPNIPNPSGPPGNPTQLATFGGPDGGGTVTSVTPGGQQLPQQLQQLLSGQGGGVVQLGGANGIQLGGANGIQLGGANGIQLGGSNNNGFSSQLQGDTNAIRQFFRRFAGRGFRRRHWRDAQNQDATEPTPQPQQPENGVVTPVVRQLRPQGASEALSLSATIYAYRLTTSHWAATDTRGKGNPSPFPPSPYDFESVDEVLNHDLFNSSRTRPSMSFRDALALANHPPPPPQMRRHQQADLHLVGTVVGEGGSGFAMCQNGNEAPTAVHVGESCAGYTLASLRRGSAVFNGPDGNQIQLQAPQPGSSQ